MSNRQTIFKYAIENFETIINEYKYASIQYIINYSCRKCEIYNEIDFYHNNKLIEYFPQLYILIVKYVFRC